MLSKRIVAIAGDKAFARKLASGLMAAGGTVETAAGLDELAKGEIHAELVVVHVPQGSTEIVAQVTARMKKEAGLIAVIDRSELEQIIDVHKAGRVSAVLVADDLRPAVLAATATRMLYGDVFGLEKVMPWGVKIYSTLVGDYQEKSIVISAVADYATAIGVRRKYRESIEQVLDECLMNALYDAPVDAQGNQMFADVPTKTRISLRMEQKAVVQYACEGDLFGLSVRDSFGALKPDTVIKYIDKCLHSDQQIDRKAGGAGLGLYIIANAATQFIVNIYPGVATEVVTTFDLTAPKVQLKHFGVYSEKIDSAGRLVAGPSKLVGAGRAEAAAPPAAASRGVTLLLSAAIVLLLAMIGVVAYPRFAEQTGSLAVTTDPPGATIEVDGRTVGTSAAAPVQVADMPLGEKVKVSARLEGYEPAELIAEPGKQGTPVQLKLVPRAAVVTIESDPPGAMVVVSGQERGPTPTTLTDLPPGSEQQVTLRRTGYADLVKQVKVPGPGREAQLSWNLSIAPDFGALRIESEPPGAQVLQNGELLAGVTTPVPELLVQAGRPYVFTLKLPGYQPLRQEITVEPGARGKLVTGTLSPGGSLTVNVNLPDVIVTVDKVPACTDKPAPLVDCALPKGKHKVVLRSDKPAYSAERTVEIKDSDVTLDIALGVVEAEGDALLQVPRSRKTAKRIALPAGRTKVQVVDPRSGQAVERSVNVQAGATVRVGK